MKIDGMLRQRESIREPNCNGILGHGKLPSLRKEAAIVPFIPTAISADRNLFGCRDFFRSSSRRCHENRYLHWTGRLLHARRLDSGLAVSSRRHRSMRRFGVQRERPMAGGGPAPLLQRDSMRATPTSSYFRGQGWYRTRLPCTIRLPMGERYCIFKARARPLRCGLGRRSSGRTTAAMTSLLSTSPKPSSGSRQQRQTKACRRGVLRQHSRSSPDSFRTQRLLPLWRPLSARKPRLSSRRCAGCGTHSATVASDGRRR